MCTKARFLAFFCLFLWVSASFGEISVFRYEEEPNEGDHPIAGVENGAEFLPPFQYVVEVSNEPAVLSTEGEVEVAFYNQFGQLLHIGPILHPPFNNPNNPEQVVNSPNLPMLEGRTQLLSWAREADGRPVFLEISNPPSSGTVPVALNNGNVACVPSVIGGNCSVTFTPPAGPAVSVNVPAGPPVGIGSDLPANTNVVIAGAAASTLTTITGETGPTEWFFGPHVFQQGPAQGDFIFIDTDQGPPAAPFIDHFRCQGTTNCIDPPLMAEIDRSSTDPFTNRFRYTVVFNKRDLFEATNSAGSGVPLTLEYSGFVFNNPALFQNPNGSTGLPGARPKPESNAFFDSNLFAVEFSSSIAPETARKTTITGPYAISVEVGTPGVPQVVYPDEFIAFPYNSPVFPSQTPFPVKYPFGGSLAPGLYQTVAYDFTSMIDGDYEIWATADDFLAASTNNGQSPGSLLPSGDRVPGTTTIIKIIRDTLPPNSFEAAFVPPKPFLILSDQEEPPLPYTTYQAEVFRLGGRVQDERNDENIVQVDVRRDDGTLVTRAGKNGHFEQIPTFGGNFSQLMDFTPEDPDSTASPVGQHPAVGGQRAYQMLVYPVDPQLNTAETTRALYLIKDLQPPQNPEFEAPVPGLGVVTDTSLGVSVISSNDFLNPAPFLDLREHGIVEMELFVIDSTGVASRFTTQGDGVISAGASASSSLDDHPSWQFPGSPLGGQGVDGIDFFGDVPDLFRFQRTINLQEFADGTMTLTARLFDQVGNPSALTTSLNFVKDTTGPRIVISEQDRIASGPDNNYPTPNFLGADDSRFLVSLISPELTVDNGPLTAVPTVADPGSRDFLAMQGRVVDGITQVDRVELDSAHVTTLVSDVSGLNVNDAPFSFEIDLRNIPEALEEVIELRGFDENGIGGAVKTLRVVRDIEPARPVAILQPPLIPTTGKHQVYTSADRILIRGQLDAQDAVIVDGLNPEDFFARVAILTPSTAPGSFVTGDSVPRLPRSSPTLIPREDSFFRSFPTTSSEASYFVTRPSEEGFFELEIPVTHFPASRTTPTTIWVQAIDAFENTDPVHAVPIEVFYLPDGAPIASLALIDFFGEGERTQIFPPLSLPPALLTTLFTGLEAVDLEVETFVPMTKAPTLELRQFDAPASNAEVLSSQNQSPAASTLFRYRYAPNPRPGRFDGQVSARVFGGQDIFLQPVQETAVTTAFYLDSLPPNVVARPPEFTLEAIQPQFVPSQGQRLNQSGFRIQVDFDDFLTSNGSQDRSGVRSSALELSLKGPLAQDPESVVALQGVTPDAGFDIAAEVLGALADGVYRIASLGEDKVGNRRTFYSNFVFDATEVAGPLLQTNPPNQSVVRRFPVSSTRGFVDLFVKRLDADMQATDFALLDPFSQPVALDSTTLVSEYQKRKFLVSEPPYDGTSDGEWTILIEAVDEAGNTTSVVHTFLLDSIPPKISEPFPGQNQCVGPTVNLAQIQVQDLAGNPLARPSGIHPASSLALELTSSASVPPNPQRTGRIAGDVRLNSIQSSSPSSLYQLAFLPIRNQQASALDENGLDDGDFRLSSTVLDSAGNQNQRDFSFRYDSQPPQIRLSDVADPFVRITTGTVLLDLQGFIHDDGPCHFASAGPHSWDGTTLSFSLSLLDVESQTEQAVLLSDVPITNLSPVQPPDFDYHASQLKFRFTTEVAAIPAYQNYRVSLKARDKAANRRLETRSFHVIPALDAVPEILSPPLEEGGEIPIRPDGIFEFAWQPIPGRNQLEIRVDELLSTSVLEVFRTTLPMQQQTSGSVALQPGTTPTSLRTLEVRMRSLQLDGRSSPWSTPRTVIVDPREFVVEEAFLLQYSQKMAMSRPDLQVQTRQFAVEVLLNKSYRKTDSLQLREGFLQIGLEGRQNAITQILPASSPHSRRLTALVQLDVRPDQPLPTEDVHVQITDLQDESGQTLAPQEYKLPLDLGPDVAARLFSNPADPREVIAVLRFVSRTGEEVEVPVEYEESELISPQFSLRRDQASSPLGALSIGERTRYNQRVAATFSMPLRIAREQPGWYELLIGGVDLDGRVLDRELEVRIGFARQNQSFSIQEVGDIQALRLEAPQGSGMIFAGGRLLPVGKNHGELSVLWDARMFGSEPSLLNQTMELSLRKSTSKAIATTYLGWYRKVGSGFEFVHSFEPQASLQLKLGEDYFLAKDKVDPELEFTDQEFFYSGWQDLPAVFSDAGSGIDEESIKVTLDQGQRLAVRRKAETLQIKLPVQKFIAESSLKVEVQDRAGRGSHVAQSITVLAGEGVEWVQVVPNPVRGHSARFRYLFNEPGKRARLQIYDTYGSLIQSLNLPPTVGPGTVDWNLVSRSGHSVANGVYLYKLRFDSLASRTYVKTGKMAVLR